MRDDYLYRKNIERHKYQQDPNALTEHERLDRIEAQITALEAAVEALGGQLPDDKGRP